MSNALVSLRLRYSALAPYESVAVVAKNMIGDRAALDALCLAYRTEEGQLREGAFLLLVVALGDGLLRLAPNASDGGEVLEALWIAATKPGAPALLAIHRDLLNARKKDKVRRDAIQEAIEEGALSTSTSIAPLRRIQLTEALKLLSPAERELATYRALDMTAPEIARLQNKRPGAVREAISQLRKKLTDLGLTF